MSIQEIARGVLNGIVDPCSVAAGAPAGIVDMGLVRALDVNPTDNGVRICLTLATTVPTCLMAGCFAHEARQRLAAMEGVIEVEVKLEHGRVWTTSDMSADYRARLQITRASALHPELEK